MEEDLRKGRDEAGNAARNLREEVTRTISSLGESLAKGQGTLTETLSKDQASLRESLSSTLTGHDTSYNPDGTSVNPREDYESSDADAAVGQPKFRPRLVTGLQYHF